MRIEIKSTPTGSRARVHFLSGAMALANSIIVEVYRELSASAVTITSCNDPPHGKKSRHWNGNALDYRISEFSKNEQEILEYMVRQRLGPDYDVVLEDDHLHVEHDPEHP